MCQQSEKWVKIYENWCPLPSYFNHLLIFVMISSLAASLSTDNNQDISAPISLFYNSPSRMTWLPWLLKAQSLQYGGNFWWKGAGG